MEVINLSIIEDEALVLDNLELYFQTQNDIKVVSTSGSVEEFLENHTPNTSIDMFLLDIGLPGISGLEGIRPIKSKVPNADVIMLTAFDDSDRIFKALCAGAVSYITKSTDLPTIKDALLKVKRGGAYMSPSIARKVINHFAPTPKSKLEPLTPRQEQIVQGLVDGLSYKLIADKYMISVETVRDHIKKIYKKLHVNSKAEVIRKKLDGEI
jgi:DNA-binding NarL/FixJ family response regulator